MIFQRNKVLHFYLIIVVVFISATSPLFSQENQDNALGDPEIEAAEQFQNQADSLIQLSQFPKAENYLKKALAIYKDKESWTDIVKACTRASKKLFRNKQTERALRFLKVAEITGEEHFEGQDLLLAECYSQLADVYMELGRFDPALTYFKKTLQIREEQFGPNDPRLGESYYKIGVVYYDLGNYDQALLFNQKALNNELQLHRETHQYVASTYSNIGLIYFQMENFSAALESYQKSLQILTSLYDRTHPRMTATLTNLARTYLRLGEYNNAEKMSTQALSLMNLLFEPSHEDFIFNFSILSEIEAKRGNYSKSLEYLNEALGRRTEVNSEKSPEIADSFLSIGELYAQKSEYKEALRYFQKGLHAISYTFDRQAFTTNPEASEVFSPIYALKLIHAKAKVFKEQYKKFGNAEYLENSFNTYNDLIEWVRVFHHRTNIHAFENYNVKVAKEIFDGGIDIAYESGRINQEKKEFYYEAAYKFAEEYKLAKWLEELKNKSNLSFYGLEDSILLLDKVNRIELSYLQKAELAERRFEEFGNTKQLDAINKSLDSLKVIQDTLLQTIKDEHPSYYELRYNFPSFSLDQVKTKLKEEMPNTGILQFHSTDTVSYAFSLQEQELDLIKLNGNDKLQTIVSEFHSSISNFQEITYNPQNSYLRYTKSGFDLYNLLVEPIFKTSSGGGLPDQLVIIPDSRLCYLPFEALLTEEVKEQTSYRKLPYLINQTSISYAYGTQFLLNDVQAQISKNGTSYSGWGAEYNQSTMVEISDLAQIGFNENLERSNLRSKNEITEISIFMDGAKRFGRVASEGSFKLSLPDFGIQHLALYGTVNNNKPLESKIIFHLTNKNSQNYNEGILHTSEIYNLKTNTNLFLLTSLHPESIKTANENSFLHLSRALSYAGCPTNIKNLWTCDDPAIVDIQKDFFKNLKNGEWSSLSLHKAKLAAIGQKNESKAHPYYWAGLILSGRPLPLQKQLPLFLWILGALAFLGVGAGGYLFFTKPK